MTQSIQQELKKRIFQILIKEKTDPHEHIYTFNKDGNRSYYLKYETDSPGSAKNGFYLFLESQQITHYPVDNLIDPSIVDQIVSDILDTEVIASIMEVDNSLRGWTMTEKVGIGIMNPRGLNKLSISSKVIKTP